MIKVDLITGFLGSGKTTFIKKYAAYLLKNGRRLGILENDYGAVNVDMLLLSELEGENCGLDMVAGACDADCHKRRFKTKLIAMGMSGYDRVLIEPSGVFDVDEFFDSLYEEPLDRWYEIGSVIAVVDANLEEGLSGSADYLLASQIANAGKIILSKTQLASAEETERTIAHMEQALKKVKCARDIRPDVIAKDWDKLTDADFESIMNGGHRSEAFIKRGTTDESGFGSVYFLGKSFIADELKAKARAVFEDKACGNVFRVKGFFRADGGWMEFNATKSSAEISPVTKGQETVIVIGERLDREKINYWFDK